MQHLTIENDVSTVKGSLKSIVVRDSEGNEVFRIYNTLWSKKSIESNTMLINFAFERGMNEIRKEFKSLLGLI